MRTNAQVRLLTLLALTSAFSLPPSALFGQGTAFTYQGQLTDGPQPASGIYDLRFTIYDTAGGGSPLAGPLTNSPVRVTDGLFTVTLDFGAGVFTGTDRWLEIGVRTNGGGNFTLLSPRQPLTPSPYALFAPSAGAAASATTATTVGAGGVGNASLQANAVTTDKIADGTIGTADVATIDAGKIVGGDLTAARLKVGTNQTLSGAWATIAGGLLNTASDYGATVGGGHLNTVSGYLGTVAGGANNAATNYYATVSGGYGGLAGGPRATVAGGEFNTATGYGATVSGGVGNWGAGDYASLGGGAQNTNSGVYSTVGGGAFHLASGNAVTIGGGYANSIGSAGSYSTIAGGGWNQVEGKGGGSCVIGGGQNNQIVGTNSGATISGGIWNRVESGSAGSAIGGGAYNTIGPSASYAMIPGGRDNNVTGAYGFAAGRRAKALHDGALVWTDATDADFVSTKTNQFLIRAGGGVGIGTNNPQSALHVAGTVTASGFSGNGAGLTGLSGAALAAGSVSESALASGAVTSAKIADGTVAAADVNAATFNTTFWRATGNAGTTPGTHFLGTTDNQPLEFKVNGQRVLRLEPHTNSPNVIGGHPGNFIAAGVWGSTISGGGSFNYPNVVFGPYGTIGGGAYNTIETNAWYATIGGGEGNTIQTNTLHATIGGGAANTIQTDAYGATIGGGWGHTIQITTYGATIGGGEYHTIQTYARAATIGGGYGNTILHGGAYATIPGGRENSATELAFAAGNRAKADHLGAFVWADSTDADFASTRPNQFNLRATGGVRVDTGSGPGISLSAADTPLITRGWDPFGGTAPAAKQGHGRWGLFMEPHSLVVGMPEVVGKSVRVAKYAPDGTYTALATFDQAGNLAITGTLSQASDREAKEQFEAVNPAEVLAKVVALPVSRWQFKEDAAGARHLGPMAQDFHAAFGLGTDDKHIATVDADGVALAAIQGLNQKLTEELKRRDAENAELRRELTELKQLVQQLFK